MQARLMIITAAALTIATSALAEPAKPHGAQQPQPATPPAEVVLASAESAQDVISRLQDDGYTVTIDRIGTAPLDQCVVTSVRNPQSISQLQPLVSPGNRDSTILVPVIVSQTVSVSLNCSP